VTGGEDLDDSIKILAYGRDIARQRGAGFLVVLLETRNTFKLRSEVTDPWQRLRHDLEESGIAYLSLADELFEVHRDHPAALINEDGSHYTASAQAFIAAHLARSEVVRGVMALRTRPGAPESEASRPGFAGAPGPARPL
jgi:hypothetical protein